MLIGGELMNRNDLPSPNAICEVCGKSYYRCARCIELKGKGIDTWKLHCDVKPCYEKFYAVSMAEKELIDKEEFYNIISKELPEEREYTEEFSSKVNKLMESFGFKANDDIVNVKTETQDSNDSATVNSERQKNKKVRHRSIQNVK